MLVAEVRCAHAASLGPKEALGKLCVTPDGMTHRLLAQRAQEEVQQVEVPGNVPIRQPLVAVERQEGEDATHGV